MRDSGPGAGIQDSAASSLPVTFPRCILGLAVAQQPLLGSAAHGILLTQQNLPLTFLAGVFGRCALSHVG